MQRLSEGGRADSTAPQESAFVNICMIGAGYVGLLSAACFSEFGWKVACIDKDADRITRLRRGNAPIYEPLLKELLSR